jgi:hypothetical protein
MYQLQIQNCNIQQQQQQRQEMSLLIPSFESSFLHLLNVISIQIINKNTKIICTFDSIINDLFN